MRLVGIVGDRGEIAHLRELAHEIGGAGAVLARIDVEAAAADGGP